MKRPESLSSYTASATRPAHEPPANPGPGAPFRSRSWERRAENKSFSYRIGQDVDDLLTQAVDEMAAEGWVCTKSEMARAWLLAGREAWQAGTVEVDGYERRPGRSRRNR